MSIEHNKIVLTRNMINGRCRIVHSLCLPIQMVRYYVLLLLLNIGNVIDDDDDDDDFICFDFKKSNLAIGTKNRFRNLMLCEILTVNLLNFRVFFSSFLSPHLIRLRLSRT